MLKVKPARLLTLFILLFAGCSSLPLQKARTAFYEGNLAEADHILRECAGISRKDRLLCYMEEGVILHYSGDYQSSAEVLLKASETIKLQEQISISEQTSAALINDRVQTYKGEYCERLWVHTFLMMNFLLQGKLESALVEGRQALEVFDAFTEPLEGDFFTRALIALCFENMNLPDDARIEYDKLSAAMGVEKFTAVSTPSGRGELILFIGQGRIPYKVADDVVLPPSIRLSIPRYAEAFPTSSVVIRSAGRNIDSLAVSTHLGDVARISLDARSAAILTRQALRAGTKEAIAQEAGKESPLVEAMARIILLLLEEADTRSWETLPGSLTLVRIELDSGIHNLEVSLENSDTVYLDGIEIPEGKRVYRSFRF